MSEQLNKDIAQILAIDFAKAMDEYEQAKQIGTAKDGKVFLDSHKAVIVTVITDNLAGKINLGQLTIDKPTKKGDILILDNGNVFLKRKEE